MRSAARLGGAARNTFPLSCSVSPTATSATTVARDEPHGRRAGGGSQPAIRWYEIQQPRRERPAAAWPRSVLSISRDVRPGRRTPVDGLDRPGPQRQHGHRLQHLLRRDVPVDRHHRPAGRRSARTAGRRGHLARRRRQPGNTPRAGATTARSRSTRRRLHVLVHQGVLPDDGSFDWNTRIGPSSSRAAPPGPTARSPAP